MPAQTESLIKLISATSSGRGKATTKISNFRYQRTTDSWDYKMRPNQINVTNEINRLVGICLKEKDYTTHNFLQWYVSEQIEEEALARTVLDKLKLVGDNNAAIYMFDRDIEKMTVVSAAADEANPNA